MLKIFQTFHRPFLRPSPAHRWIVPIGVGGYAEADMLTDSSGTHIAPLNPHYCELTALYWAWKNDDSPYVGFYHYRRYLNFVVDQTWQDAFGFAIPATQITVDYLSHERQAEQALRMLQACDVIIPRLNAQNLSVEAHYLKYHPAEPWEHFKALLAQRFPSGQRYSSIFQLSNLASTCNMFVMPRSIFEPYCQDLFSVIDPIWSQWGARWGGYHDRYPGFLAERFLGFWLHMRAIRVMEVPMILLEPVEGSDNG